MGRELNLDELIEHEEKAFKEYIETKKSQMFNIWYPNLTGYYNKDELEWGKIYNKILENRNKMENKERVKCPQLGCTKEIYKTGEEALDEIERIIGTQRKLTDVKPCRAYRCACGFYALTSKPKITEY